MARPATTTANTNPQRCKSFVFIGWQTAQTTRRAIPQPATHGLYLTSYYADPLHPPCHGEWDIGPAGAGRGDPAGLAGRFAGVSAGQHGARRADALRPAARGHPFLLSAAERRAARRPPDDGALSGVGRSLGPAGRPVGVPGGVPGSSNL